MNTNILYIHGFGSKFDPTSEKVQLLKTIGNVVGVDIDYTQPYSTIDDQLTQLIRTGDIDVVVGTSMGGYWANQMGVKFGVPFVAINPAIDPTVSLQKYIGTHTDYTGRTYTLDPSIPGSYTRIFIGGGYGMLLLDLGDDVINNRKTQDAFTGVYRTIAFSGGTHRFAHMKQSIGHIKDFIDRATLIYGQAND